MRQSAGRPGDPDGERVLKNAMNCNASISIELVACGCGDRREGISVAKSDLTENSGKTAKPRGKAFKPGQSGNPGGRPPKTEEQRTLEAMCREKTVEALAVVRAKRPPISRPVTGRRMPAQRPAGC